MAKLSNKKQRKAALVHLIMKAPKLKVLRCNPLKSTANTTRI